MKKSAGEKTREKILNAGVALWPDVSALAVAHAAGLTHPAVLYHFPDGTLKDAIAEHAVDVGESRVIIQLIAADHKAIKSLSAADRIRHFNAI